MTYNVITLKKGDFSAKINASLGANLISLRNDKLGVKILREPDYSAPLDNPYLYGAPLLFPVNRISGGKFNFEDREFNFPINEQKTGCHLHGELHALPFTIVNNSNSSVTLKFAISKDKPYLCYSEDLEIFVNYKLTKKGIIVKTSFKNNAKVSLPILFGYHTTFNSKFIDNAEPIVKVSFENEIERNMQNYLPTGKLLEFDSVSNELLSGTFNPLSTPISRHYKCKNNGKIEIFDKTSKLKVVYKNSKNLPFRLIYNGNADGYICLEPQTSMANSPNSPFDRDFAGFNVIKPNKKQIFVSKILLKKGK
jgi:aldose 1-epimerase